MAELEDFPADEIGAIVFLDDFSGTGETLTDWWTNVEMLVRPKQAPLVVALLVLSGSARESIEEFSNIVIAVEELTENDNVLSEGSNILSIQEKESVLGYCQRTGCEEAFCRGYGNSGLLMAFRHGCPDNSLPILWHDSDEWQSLFRRRAV